MNLLVLFEFWVLSIQVFSILYFCLLDSAIRVLKVHFCSTNHHFVTSAKLLAAATKHFSSVKPHYSNYKEFALFKYSRKKFLEFWDFYCLIPVKLALSVVGWILANWANDLQIKFCGCWLNAHQYLAWIC